MGEMASNLAHELGQPLGAVVNYAQACLRMVCRGSYNVERLSLALQQTVEQAQRAGAIIHRVRDFVRKDRARAECLNLTSLAGETLEFVSSEARGKGVRVAVETIDNLPPVRADRIQIEQVLLNLIFNSIDAMQQARSKARQVTIRFKALEGKVRVTVADTGPGLGKDVVEHIFEPFYTTKDKGMGMGLAICRSIIEAHSGRLWADSASGSGAVFHFTLPVDERRCE
jgi:signal transduction histidine kinase